MHAHPLNGHSSQTTPASSSRSNPFPFNVRRVDPELHRPPTALEDTVDISQLGQLMRELTTGADWDYRGTGTPPLTPTRIPREPGTPGEVPTEILALQLTGTGTTVTVPPVRLPVGIGGSNVPGVRKTGSQGDYAPGQIRVSNPDWADLAPGLRSLPLIGSISVGRAAQQGNRAFGPGDAHFGRT